jgi:uncharacterized coiled-coil protein SlyX
MWDEKSKRFFLVVLLACLLLFCLRWPGWSESYLITSAELAELEQILTEQEQTIETLREILTAQSTIISGQRITLMRLSGHLGSWQELISEQEILLQRYGRAVRWSLALGAIVIIETVLIVTFLKKIL